MSLLVGKILPYLGNLLDPLLPLGIVMLEVSVIDVGVEDHGNGGILPQRLVSHPLLQLILRLRAGLLQRKFSKRRGLLQQVKLSRSLLMTI